MNQISVIIPVLNEQDLVGQAIQSAQAAGADEVIVVDGNSADHSTGVATEFSCRVLSSTPGRGFQLDSGAREARGPILVFLHADGQLSGNCLDQVRAMIRQNQQAWGCFQQKIDATGFKFRWLERGNRWRAEYRRIVYGDQCFWMTSEVYRACGGFPRQPLMEDVVLSDRLGPWGPPHILEGPVEVSSRGWKRRGVMWQTLRNWTLYGLFRCGVSSERIARWYK